MRYSSQRVGELNYFIDDKAYHLTLPSTTGFNVWEDAFRVIPLTQGEHEIRIDFLEGGFNINYIQVTAEEKYPNAYIKKAKVQLNENIL